jgi:NADH-quinone oxidoreductase subunit C
VQAAEIFEALHEKLGEGVSDFTPAEGGIKDAFCLVAASSLVEACTLLRDDPALRFDFLQCLTAVDYPRDEKILSVYHLYSYSLAHSFVLKVELPRDDPKCPSVTGVWKTANWHEREQYDLFGVQYTGHPELRRLLMPDDWVGYPMRKDYQEANTYRHMSTSRYSVLELLAAYDKEHPQTEGVRPRIVEIDPDKE